MNDGLKGVTGPRSRPIPARERAEHDDREGNQHPALIGLDESPDHAFAVPHGPLADAPFCQYGYPYEDNHRYC